MHLQLPTSLAFPYQSRSQRVRVMTERWASDNVFCPACLRPIHATPPNTPSTDFSCSACAQSFELKSKLGRFGSKVVDGAYSTMASRIIEGTQPNLFLLSYDASFRVDRFEVIPRSFLTLPVIQKRKPLADTARRRGWVGCNIVISDVPQDGRIAYVRDARPVAREAVGRQWRGSKFLESVAPEARGWLVATMNCVRQLSRAHFTLGDVYSFESKLQEQFPNNRHIRPKLRQQLQLLRDRGWLRFEGSGRYSVAVE